MVVIVMLVSRLDQDGLLITVQEVSHIVTIIMQYGRWICCNVVLTLVTQEAVMV